VTYFVAGTTGVQYWKFLLYDGIAACVSAPFWVILGHWAGRHRMLHKAWQLAKDVQIGIILVVAALIAIWVLASLVRRRMRKERGPATLSAIPGGRARSEPPPLKRTNEA
jgi:membrane protein DedA with SNARE-associated domain